MMVSSGDCAFIGRQSFNEGLDLQPHETNAIAVADDREVQATFWLTVPTSSVAL